MVAMYFEKDESVMQKSDGWYWYDETGDEHGPYNTRELVEKQIKDYCKYLENGPTLWQRIRYQLLRRW